MKNVLLFLTIFALVFLCACNPSNPTEIDPTSENATTEQSGDPTVDPTQSETNNSTEDATTDATVDATADVQDPTEATTEPDWEFPIDVDESYLENNTTVGNSDEDFELPIDVDVPDTTVNTEVKPTEPNQGAEDGTTAPDEGIEPTQNIDVTQVATFPENSDPIELPMIPG